MSIPPSDASIPILTQVIGSKPAAQPPARASAGTPPEHVRPAVAEQPNAAQSEEDWKALELKLNERVLRQILRRVDFVVEHRVKESLADILQSATDDLLKEIRRGLHVTLEDIIKRAVAQEIARVQAVSRIDE